MTLARGLRMRFSFRAAWKICWEIFLMFSKGCFVFLSLTSSKAATMPMYLTSPMWGRDLKSSARAWRVVINGAIFWSVFSCSKMSSEASAAAQPIGFAVKVWP